MHDGTLFASRLVWLVILACTTGAASALVASAFDSGGAVGWIVDLALHWQWLYAAAGLIAGAAAVWLDRRRLRAVLVCAIVIVASFTQYSPRVPHSAAAAPAVKVVSANLFMDNADLMRLLTWIDQVDPDVIFLQEVTAAGAALLRRQARYQHVLIDEHAEPFAVAVLSKLPLLHVMRVQQGGEELRDQRVSFRAHLRWAERTIAIAAVHLAAPTALRFQRMRDDALLATTDWVQRQELPALVVGDLNMSPWSRALRRVAQRGLKRTTSLAPTWPAAFGLPPLIPIDHVLASQHWAVRESRRGPRFGSDHLPVFVSVSLRTSDPP